MKVLVINPNTSVEMTDGINKMANQYARKDTEITTVSSKKGPRTIESAYEESLVAEGVLERVIEGNRNGFDAIIIACYGDPHLDSAKEISDIPVFGIAEASMHIACLLGYKFSIVTVLERARPIFEELVKRTGLEEKCASIKTTNLSVADLEKDPGITLKALIEASSLAVKEDGAEVICLGCAGMCGLDKQIELSIGVPILDGVVCAVKVAELTFDYQLKHSKIKAYKKPEPKEFLGLKKYQIKQV